MTKTSIFSRKMLRSGSALQALALLGAGVGVVALTATSAAAQDYTNITASGKVVGTDGKAIPGANITVKSNDQGFSQTTTADGAGSYTIPQLRPGSYSVTVSAEGYESFTDSNVVLNQQSASNQFALAPAGGGTGDIVITAGRVRTVDFNQNTTGAVINVADLATRVPVARDLTSIILLAPGTAQGDNAFGNLPSIAGSSVSENTYYINGLNITNFRNGLGSVAVPFDFYDTVDIKNGGYSAEFGRATGGFINATTKSGSNDFHASIGFNWEPNDLSSKGRNTYATDNDSQRSDRRDFIAQISGPIIKDHLFFYGLYQSRDVETAVGTTGAVSALNPRLNPSTGLLTVVPNATQIANACFDNPRYCTTFGALPSNLPTAPTTTDRLQQFALAGSSYVTSTSRSPFYGGKIDAVIVDGQRLEFTYFNTSSLQTNQYYGTAFFSLASGGRYNPNTNDPGQALPATLGGTLQLRSGGENYVGRYTGTFTDWLTLSAAYGRNYNKTSQISSGPNAASITDTRDGVSVPLGNPVQGNTFTNDRRDFYRADVDLRFNVFGKHHVRFGYDREDLLGSSSTAYNGTYGFTYGPASALGIGGGGAYVSRRYFKNGGAYKSKSEAFYIEDQWNLFGDRLQLNLGVRDDRFTNMNNLGQAFFKSGDNFSPRVGFTADPFGKGKTKVYGSFSRYYTGVPINTNTRLAGLELDYTQYYPLLGLNADNTPIYGNATTSPGYSNNPNIGTGACPALSIDNSNGGGNNCTVNHDGQQPPFKSLVSSSLKAQSVDEYILGVEQRFASRWKVGAYFTSRVLRKSLEDAYIDKGVQAYCNRTLTGAANAALLAQCLSIFTGAHQYTLINPGDNVTVALDARGSTLDGRVVNLTAADLGLPKANRVYKSVTATIDREFDGVWGFSASYTWSSLKGNIEGGIRSDNGQADSGLTTAFDFPSLTNGTYGFLPGHRRHNIKLYGSFAPFKWLTLGANLQVQSPRKFGCIGRVPNYIDPVAGAGYGAAGWYCNVKNGQVLLLNNAGGFQFGTAPNANSATQTVTTAGVVTNTNPLVLTPRGTRFQSDWLYNLNLDAAFKIPTDKFDATIRVSVFNVLNKQAKLDFQEVGTASSGAPNATYGLPLQYQTPRYVRFQFNVGF